MHMPIPLSFRAIGQTRVAKKGREILEEAQKMDEELITSAKQARLGSRRHLLTRYPSFLPPSSLSDGILAFNEAMSGIKLGGRHRGEN